MSLAGKIAVITGAAAMEEKFKLHETADSSASSLFRTQFVECITPEEIEAHRQHILVKHLGELEDIANAALFLASGEASFIAAANIPISGGIQVGL